MSHCDGEFWTVNWIMVTTLEWDTVCPPRVNLWGLSQKQLITGRRHHELRKEKEESHTGWNSPFSTSCRRHVSMFLPQILKSHAFPAVMDGIPWIQYWVTRTRESVLTSALQRNSIRNMKRPGEAGSLILALGRQQQAELQASLPYTEKHSTPTFPAPQKLIVTWNQINISLYFYEFRLKTINSQN